MALRAVCTPSNSAYNIASGSAKYKILPAMATGELIQREEFCARF